MKRLCLLLFTLTLFCCLALAAAAAPVGDADRDGTLSAADARLVLRAAVGLDPATGELKRNCDPDGDRQITAADARAVLRAAVGLEKAVESDDVNGFAAHPEDVVDVYGLYTYEDLQADLRLLQSLYPARFTYEEEGYTVDGRRIYCAVLGTGRGSRQIVVDVGAHAEEYLNPAAVMADVEFTLRQYDDPVSGGRTPREILADTDVYLFPMLNPDGVTISQSGLTNLQPETAERLRGIYEAEYAAGRTEATLDDYLKGWKANANGVDINRNALFSRTGRDYDTGVRAPASEEFPGNRAAPEAETATYLRLLDRLRNPVAVLSIHSQGSLIYWICGQNETDLTAARRLTEIAESVTGYYAEPEDSFVGALADWAMLEKHIPAVTIETGLGGSPLPLTQQPEIAERLSGLILAVADGM